MHIEGVEGEKFPSLLQHLRPRLWLFLHLHRFARNHASQNIVISAHCSRKLRIFCLACIVRFLIFWHSLSTLQKNLVPLDYCPLLRYEQRCKWKRFKWDRAARILGKFPCHPDDPNVKQDHEIRIKIKF